MTTHIVKRIDKGFPLTYQELDENFENLRATADNTKVKTDVLSAVLSSSKVDVTSLTPDQILDSTVINEVRTVKYVVQILHNNQLHVEEILITSNGVESYISEYGVLAPSGEFSSFSTGVVDGSLILYVTPLFQPLNISFVKQVLQ